MKWKKTFWGFLILLALLVGDQVTKYLAVIHLKDADALLLIPGVFELRYLENYGAAFGVLQNQRILLLMVTAGVLMVVCFFYWKIPLSKRDRKSVV